MPSLRTNVLLRGEETGGHVSVTEIGVPPHTAGPPVHTHDFDETFYLLEGEILLDIDGERRELHAGGVVVIPRGVPHAFMVTSPTRILTLQTPGSGEAFFRLASEPVVDGQPAAPVDFGRIRDAALQTGAIEILGPPPFGNPNR